MAKVDRWKQTAERMKLTLISCLGMFLMIFILTDMNISIMPYKSTVIFFRCWMFSIGYSTSKIRKVYSVQFTYLKVKSVVKGKVSIDFKDILCVCVNI